MTDTPGMADAPVEPTPEACKAVLPILWPNGLPFALSDHDHREIRRVALALDAFAAQARTAAIEMCAQLAFDQTSDDPPPGDWNEACEHICEMQRALARPIGEPE